MTADHLTTAVLAARSGRRTASTHAHHRADAERRWAEGEAGPLRWTPDRTSPATPTTPPPARAYGAVDRTERS